MIFKYKKILGAMGIFLVFFSIFFFIQPKKAEAIVPVFDAPNYESNTITALATGSLVKKEFGWDTIMWAFVNVLLKNMINSVTDWVNNGFNGNPLFVTDMKRFLRDAGVEASGVYMEEYLSPEVYDMLCEPWRFEIAIGLNIYRKDRTYPECTLLDVIANAEDFGNFMTDFRYGGWPAWFSMFQGTTNNPYSDYVTNIFAMNEEIAKAEANAKSEAEMGGGFLGVKECVQCLKYKYDEFGGVAGCAVCGEWETHSPGSWVQDKVNLATGSELRRLEVADEINELAGALIGQLWNWIAGGLSGGLSSGYSGTSYVPNYGPDYPDGFIPGEIPDLNPPDLNEGGPENSSSRIANVSPKQITDSGSQNQFTALVADGPSTIYYTLDGSTPNGNSSKYMKAPLIRNGQTIKLIIVSADGTATSSIWEFYAGGFEKAALMAPTLNATGKTANLDDKTFIELSLAGSYDGDSTNQIAMYEWDLDYDGDYDWWMADYNRDGVFEETGSNQQTIGQSFIEIDKDRDDLPGVVRVRYDSLVNKKFGTRITDNEGLYKEAWFYFNASDGGSLKGPLLSPLDPNNSE